MESSSPTPNTRHVHVGIVDGRPFKDGIRNSASDIPGLVLPGPARPGEEARSRPAQMEMAAAATFALRQGSIGGGPALRDCADSAGSGFELTRIKRIWRRGWEAQGAALRQGSGAAAGTRRERGREGLNTLREFARRGGPPSKILPPWNRGSALLKGHGPESQSQVGVSPEPGRDESELSARYERGTARRAGRPSEIGAKS